MAKRKSKKSPTKPARKAASKPAWKKNLSRADRATILAEASSKGWTAEQIAKRAGVSKWAVYGWNKRSAAKGRGTATKRGRKVRSTRQATGSLAEMLRPVIAEMVRGEFGEAGRRLSHAAIEQRSVTIERDGHCQRRGRCPGMGKRPRLFRRK